MCYNCNMFYNRRTIAFLLYNSPKPIVKAYLIFISIQEEIMENLSLSKNNRYLTQCGKPFFLAWRHCLAAVSQVK